MAIDLKRCVEIVESGDWISLCFITADTKRGNGGKLIELKRCRIARNRQPNANKSTSNTIPSASNATARNPQHNYHFTRNLELPNKRLVKVHPLLIFQINNQQVI